MYSYDPDHAHVLADRQEWSATMCWHFRRLCGGSSGGSIIESVGHRSRWMARAALGPLCDDAVWWCRHLMPASFHCRKSSYAFEPCCYASGKLPLSRVSDPNRDGPAYHSLTSHVRIFCSSLLILHLNPTISHLYSSALSSSPGLYQQSNSLCQHPYPPQTTHYDQRD